VNEYRVLASGGIPAVCLLLSGLFFAPVASASVDGPPLEKMRFFLYGQEKDEIGTSRAIEGQLELRLFSPAVASFYTVQIETSDLISSFLISPAEMAKIRAHRERLQVERERMRVERRRLRALELEEEKKAGKSRSSRSSRGGPPRHPVDLPPGGISASEIPEIESASDAKALLSRFRIDVEDLEGRCGQQLLRAGSNSALVAEWIENSDKTPIFVRKLNGELADVSALIGKLNKRLGGREAEILRYALEVDRGSIRPRDLEEIGENLQNRILSCAKNLDTIEARLGAAVDAVAGLPPPVAVEAEVEEQKPSRPVKSGARISADKKSPAVHVSADSVSAVKAISYSGPPAQRPSRTTERRPDPPAPENPALQRADAGPMQGAGSEKPEDPDEEGWLVFIYLTIGLGTGVALASMRRWIR